MKTISGSGSLVKSGNEVLSLSHFNVNSRGPSGGWGEDKGSAMCLLWLLLKSTLQAADAPYKLLRSITTEHTCMYVEPLS